MNSNNQSRYQEIKDQQLSEEALVLYKKKYSEALKNFSLYNRNKSLSFLMRCYIISILLEHVIQKNINISRLSYAIGIYDFGIRTMFKNQSVPEFTLTQVLNICDYLGVSVVEIKKRIITDLQVAKGAQYKKTVI